jgi:hypothetical protein
LDFFTFFLTAFFFLTATVESPDQVFWWKIRSEFKVNLIEITGEFWPETTFKDQIIPIKSIA